MILQKSLFMRNASELILFLRCAINASFDFAASSEDWSKGAQTASDIYALVSAQRFGLGTRAFGS